MRDKYSMDTMFVTEHLKNSGITLRFCSVYEQFKYGRPTVRLMTT